LKFPFVRKDLLKELSIKGLVGDSIQQWDIDLQLLKHFQKFSKLGLKFAFGKYLRERNRGPIGLNHLRLSYIFMLILPFILRDQINFFLH